MTLKSKMTGFVTILAGLFVIAFVEVRKTGKEIAQACSKIGETK